MNLRVFIDRNVRQRLYVYLNASYYPIVVLYIDGSTPLDQKLHDVQKAGGGSSVKRCCLEMEHTEAIYILVN